MEKQEKKQKTPKNGKPETLFKKGQSGNPNGRPKGRKNYKTILMEAAEEIAKKEGFVDEKGNPDKDYVLSLVFQKHLARAVKGDAKHFTILTDRLFGKVPQTINLSVTEEDLEEAKQKLEQMVDVWEESE